MTPDIHTLAGAYVLDAVDPQERASFEAHLSECESCRDEVAALQNATAALAASEAIPPPDALRARVLAAAAQTPQLPPLGRPAHAAPKDRRRWVPRVLAAAAAVVVLAGVGVVLVREAVEDEAPPPVTAAQVFAAEDAQVDSYPLGDGEVRVGISAELDRIAVDGSDMPAPPPEHAYQLWLVHDGQAESLSVMEGDETTAVEEIPEDGVLAVTVEPSGGSDQPTTDPIFSVDPGEL